MFHEGRILFCYAFHDIIKAYKQCLVYSKVIKYLLSE